jgi:hypothetical protein
MEFMMKWSKILAFVVLISLLSACSPSSTSTPTLSSATPPTVAPTEAIAPTETIIPTKTATPTPERPALPEGVSNLTVYNYETKKDEILSPIFDESISTWVWKNVKGEVRRFLDPETNRVFAQTEAPYDQLIYQIDKDFGWEADLTNIDKISGGTPVASGYLHNIFDYYPETVNQGNAQTKLIFKIVHGSYDDIIDKSKVSSIRSPGYPDTEMSFFWPVYDEKNNTYTLTTYLNFDYMKVKEAIQSYSIYMLNQCPISFFPDKYTIGTVIVSIPKKSIQ